MATVVKKKKAEKSAEAKVVGVQVKTLALEDVASNTAQSRGMGVLTNLAQMGYGLFEKGSAEDKEPIWGMLFSERPEEVAAACSLIEENEPELVSLADDQRATTQLQSVGVYEVGKGCYDVIFGMRRCLAAAFNHARHDDPADIEAKVFTFDGTPSPAQLLLMALSENDKRAAESPMDRAISYKRLEREGLSTEEIGRRTQQSGQSVRRYLLLLDKRLEDKRMLVHAGKLTVENALKILEARKKGLPDSGRAPNPEGERYRLPSVKGIIKILDAKARPKKMEQEEWELWCEPTVRKFLCLKLGLNPAVYPAPTPEQEPAADESAPKKRRILQVKKKAAVELMICLGKMDARTWDEEILKNKLENILTVAEDGAETKVEKHQKLFDRLVTGYADGVAVEITD